MVPVQPGNPSQRRYKVAPVLEGKIEGNQPAWSDAGRHGYVPTGRIRYGMVKGTCMMVRAECLAEEAEHVIRSFRPILSMHAHYAARGYLQSLVHRLFPEISHFIR